MAWRLNHSIIRGEIDNRTRDRVTGRFWIIGRELPIELTLAGNTMRDIAGCLLTFENPHPHPKENTELCPIQMGEVGDMTASRKVRILDIPLEEAIERIERSEPIPEHVGNAIYLEWYSRANGRVVIESSDYTTTISPHTWRMTAEEERLQSIKNVENAEGWVEELSEEFSEEDRDDDWHMDEFEWEKQLKESDAMTTRYSELLDRYGDDPDREAIINREMGWPTGELDLSNIMAEDSELIAAETPPWEEPFHSGDDLPELIPNPLTEGKDWIQGKDGYIRHPLCEKASNLANTTWRHCKDQGLIENDDNPDLQDMLFQTHTLAAKLAGALNSLAYEDEPDGGFVVACLKRSLQFFEGAISGAARVSEQKLLPDDVLNTFRNELFLVRQEILGLMKYYRQLQ